MKILQIRPLLTVLAVMAFAGGVSTATGTNVAKANALADSCTSGNSVITDDYGSGFQIQGTGVGNPVTMSTAGNCFHLINEKTISGHDYWEYENSDNHCLTMGSDSDHTIEVDNCSAGATDQLFSPRAVGNVYTMVTRYSGDIMCATNLNEYAAVDLRDPANVGAACYWTGVN